VADTGAPYLIPYPELNDEANVPADMKRMADAVATALNTVDTRAASRAEGLKQAVSTQLITVDNNNYHAVVRMMGGGLGWWIGSDPHQGGGGYGLSIARLNAAGAAQKALMVFDRNDNVTLDCASLVLNGSMSWDMDDLAARGQANYGTVAPDGASWRKATFLMATGEKGTQRLVKVTGELVAEWIEKTIDAKIKAAKTASP
jgi:hypothetical protein